MSVASNAADVVARTRAWGRVAVAFSAGVDSAVVCKAAVLAGNDPIAVTAVSPSLAEGELDTARRLADAIGIRHVILRTEEFNNSDYTSNPTDRCRHCKTELYSRLTSRKEELQFDVIVNGTNTDDLGDYRPGLQAATAYSVRSPLVEAGCDKSAVRELARYWDLSVWDKPATPCLSSRVAYGVTVTPERLRRIDRAEQFLREQLQLAELRVRCEPGDAARVEVPLPQLDKTLQMQRTVAEHLISLGFASVTIDPRGFRSGSMNDNLPTVALQVPSQK